MIKPLLIISAAAVGLLLLSQPHPPNPIFRSKPPGQSTPLSGIALGVYQPASDPLSHGTAVDKYTKIVGKKPALAWFSVKWQNLKTGQYQHFDPRLLEQFRTKGIMPGLNWDASRGPALNKNQPDFSWKGILSGKHDAYITDIARDAATYQHPFLIRLFPEMNGNWYPWAYSANGNTNLADFVAAWKHVVDIFRKEGAINVQFVYCQSALEAGKINSNREKLQQIYPGDDYVDWIALDGYSNSRNRWRSLKDEFQPSYALLTSLSERPLILYEVGAAENPNDSMFKANWITEGFLTAIPQYFPKVVAVNWFNGHDDDNIDTYDVDTSQNSLEAWKKVVASPLYQGSLLK